MYTGQQAVSAYGLKDKIPPISFSVFLWPKSMFCRGPCPDSRTLWQPVHFTLTVDRTTGCELDTRQCVFCVCMCVCVRLRAATAEPALGQTLGSQRICSWWSQTFLPWRRAAGTARYQTSYCEKKISGNIVVIPFHCQHFLNYSLNYVCRFKLDIHAVTTINSIPDANHANAFRCWHRL